MANRPPFATLNHFAGDLGILRVQSLESHTSRGLVLSHQSPQTFSDCHGCSSTTVLPRRTLSFPPDTHNWCLSPAKEWSVQGLIDLIDIGLFEPERRFERSKSDSISGLRPWSSPTAVETRFTTHNGLVPVFVRLITRGGTWVPSRATIYQRLQI